MSSSLCPIAAVRPAAAARSLTLSHTLIGRSVDTLQKRQSKNGGNLAFSVVAPNLWDIFTLDWLTQFLFSITLTKHIYSLWIITHSNIGFILIKLWRANPLF